SEAVLGTGLVGILASVEGAGGADGGSAAGPQRLPRPAKSASIASPARSARPGPAGVGPPFPSRGRITADLRSRPSRHAFSTAGRALRYPGSSYPIQQSSRKISVPTLHAL